MTVKFSGYSSRLLSGSLKLPNISSSSPGGVRSKEGLRYLWNSCGINRKLLEPLRDNPASPFDRNPIDFCEDGEKKEDSTRESFLLPKKSEEVDSSDANEEDNDRGLSEDVVTETASDSHLYGFFRDDCNPEKLKLFRFKENAFEAGAPWAELGQSLQE
tara:strand:- start:273 stop:749 length:477 start_codon:yes stop_codon:yes gene_type:complete